MMVTLDLTNALVEKKDLFHDLILSWARFHFRNYPWRYHQQNPYAILVAELLLKRTTATAAANVYPVFFKKYPTLLHLAAAPEEELMQDLSPVGLHRQRAKAIAQLARHLTEEEDGTLPSSLERLLEVPGLGEYSARAILSFGFGVPVAVVDANVERVIQRVFWQAPPASLSRATLQSVADAVLPAEAHREFNFGLLDLGALVCRYVAPRCTECPLNTVCDFYRLGAATGAQVAAATKLRETRLAKGMGLVELAKKAGMSKLTIINIEAGRTYPSARTIEKLSLALEVAPIDLMPKRQEAMGEGK